MRPRSTHELSSRLIRAGFEVEEVEAEVQRLQAVGLLDDEAFARELVDHHVSVRRSGRRAVASALFAKGVDRATIERTLDELAGGSEQESERAAALAADRARRLQGLAPPVAFGRLVAFLGRRGYGAEVARSAARQALDLDRSGQG